ncbi:DUF2637 domain-containing protein [Streptomyces sp. NPDC098789]|uniref:DUF2637 domain-containing protein n=1 Tax=Streptomyces sp. NPDC098789 TaxID=3366098 RepID=UPI0037F68FDE
MTSPAFSFSPASSPARPSLAVAIRTGVALMALGAFALSYDALRQMAAASHVHPALTYVFPLLVDGFIALGIGALLVLHAGPLRARLYVASLVALATATSIWANVLHAIRLNQQARHTGLPLDDITVGAISAIAPLALAGAVHFYLLVQRQPATRHNTAVSEAATRHKPQAVPEPHREPVAEATAPNPVEAGQDMAEPTRKQEAEIDTPPNGMARKPSVTLEQAVEIGRTAQRGRGGHASRRHIEDAIRSKGFTVNKDLADEAKDILQSELDGPPASMQ